MCAISFDHKIEPCGTKSERPHRKCVLNNDVKSCQCVCVCVCTILSTGHAFRHDTGGGGKHRLPGLDASKVGAAAPTAINKGPASLLDCGTGLAIRLSPFVFGLRGPDRAVEWLPELLPRTPGVCALPSEFPMPGSRFLLNGSNSGNSG